jgi:hypothetical protein
MNVLEARFAVLEARLDVLIALAELIVTQLDGRDAERSR